MKISDVDFTKGDCGLVPVVVQKANCRRSGKILMLAYANEEAVSLTLETGFAHFYSRSRGRLWKKGETSGNVLKIVDILVDCDADALVYRVETTGSVCHTGQMNCFFRKIGQEKRVAK